MGEPEQKFIYLKVVDYLTFTIIACHSWYIDDGILFISKNGQNFCAYAKDQWISVTEQDRP